MELIMSSDLRGPVSYEGISPLVLRRLAKKR
jgi:hypothetical protein